MNRESRERVDPPAGAISPWVQLRSGTSHPFIYRKMIRQADPAARAGEVVNVYDKDDRFFGRGLYNPRSKIVVRTLTHQDVPIDAAFWRGRFEQAVALRRALRIDETTDAYRLVHSEGDQVTGLIVERFADALVFEVFSLGIFQRIEELSRLVGEVLGPPVTLERPDSPGAAWRVYMRADQRLIQLEGLKFSGGPTQIAGEPATHVTVREHGVRYRVDIQFGHKTGFFCDQRDNRRRLASFCRGCTVLDLCCYTGGFSLAAKKLGQAESVTGVDLDESAIAMARENANLNQVRVEYVFADAFTYLRQMIANGRVYDVVVLDPPKMAMYRRDIDEALVRYNDLNHLAMQVVRRGGLLLTCSCSGLVTPAMFEEALQRAALRAGRSLQKFDYTSAAPDHPIMWNCPESFYLKAFWFRVL